MQTFCESGFEFKVLADVCATGHYVPLAEAPHISIVPGAPHTWRAVLPTLRRPGERFQMGLKAEDLWGNPSHLASARLRLEPSLPVAASSANLGLPLASALVEMHGGQLDIASRLGRGTRVSVTLPPHCIADPTAPLKGGSPIKTRDGQDVKVFKLEYLDGAWRLLTEPDPETEGSIKLAFEYALRRQ